MLENARTLTIALCGALIPLPRPHPLLTDGFSAMVITERQVSGDSSARKEVPARLFRWRTRNKTRPSRSLLIAMHSTISQIIYPNRQAFFEKLALSLPPQPAIKIGPAPLPSGERRPGLRNMRRAVPTESLSTAQRSMGKSRRSQGEVGLEIA